ncbi:cofilin [Tulasnella sp. 417]|nr:cofilin [Tulasnella sp. 417]
MSSGVGVNEESVRAYNELKQGKPGKKWKYVIYKLNSAMTEIIVDKTSEDKDYETFLGDLPSDEPRWAVYDFEYSKGEEGKRNKITFFSWTPDAAKIKQRMVYASSRESLKRTLVGIAAEIQATDTEDTEYSNVLGRVSRGA